MELNNLINFNPKSCINGQIRRIGLVTSNIFRKYLSPFGLTESQASILFILTKTEGKTQKQLTQITKLEKSSLNRNLKRLLDRKYISRVEFPIITITPLGKNLVNDVVPEWKKAMAEIKDRLTPEGEKSLQNLYQLLIEK